MSDPVTPRYRLDSSKRRKWRHLTNPLQQSASRMSVGVLASVGTRHLTKQRIIRNACLTSLFIV